MTRYTYKEVPKSGTIFKSNQLGGKNTRETHKKLVRIQDFEIISRFFASNL